MNEIRKVLDKADAVISDIEAMQSLPAGGAWYPDFTQVENRVHREGNMCTTEAIVRAAIDLFRERGGQVVRQYRFTGAVGWLDHVADEEIWRRFVASPNCETRELVVRGSGQVDDDAAQAYQDQLEDAEVQARMIREALGVAYEPHQSLHDRTLARVRELTSQPAVAGEAGVVAFRFHPNDGITLPSEWHDGSPSRVADAIANFPGYTIELACSRQQPTVPDEVMAAAEQVAEGTYQYGSQFADRAAHVLRWLKSTTHSAAAAKDRHEQG